jgi:chemotaxis protein methyltransferase CheR
MTLPARNPPIEGSVGFSFSSSDFESIALHAQRLFGLHLPAGKRDLVYARLIKRLRALGLQDFQSYCRLLDSGDEAEQQQMLSALTTNVTHFFREGHHFETLRSLLLPPLLEMARRGDRVRLWSAGCSSGQEPYSIALTILEMMPDASRYDIRILATDVDKEILARARAGTYAAEEVDGIDQSVIGRYFQIAGGSASASAELGKLITFAELNLMNDWPMRGGFDVIFCRNVAIYFDKPTQQRLWGRFANLLRPEGHLFIGHSERISGPAETLFKGVGVTTYRRVGPNAAIAEGTTG